MDTIWFISMIPMILVFSILSYYLGKVKGHTQGAQWVLEEWRNHINKMGDMEDE